MTDAVLLPLVVAPAALWGWYVLAYLEPPFGISYLRDRLRRIWFFRSLFHCPWCCGIWLSAVGVTWLSLALSLDPWVSVVDVFASAGLVGLAGSMLPDTGEVT